MQKVRENLKKKNNQKIKKSYKDKLKCLEDGLKEERKMLERKILF
ncbi:conserved hypothetical protein (plasmid) [Borreliella burgdorferi 29805]|nr:hypothetical protein [Borreliella burgdorferi]ACN55747.1 conserved hypothetical protein [Borreliella burgdorferi WI91-23]ACO38364.1 conserved hypothetical protein [Borreliella burgdorferi 29805]